MNNQTNITFVDYSDDVKKTLENLSKSALGDSAKIIRAKLRSNVPVRSKRIKNHIASWKFIDKKTGQPTLQIGFQTWQKVKKRGRQPSTVNPNWLEFGTRPHIMPGQNNVWSSGRFMKYDDMIFGSKVHHPGAKPTNILRNTVYENIDEIRKSQEKYLKEMSKILTEIKIPETPDEESE